MTDARHLTHALAGKWFGYYSIAYCPAHDNQRTPALSLSNGDDGRLLAKCHAGCTFPEIIGALRERGLLGPDNFSRLATLAGASAQKKKTDRAHRERMKAKALSAWASTEPIRGTLAERYLRARAIRCRLPDPLRFDPVAFHSGYRVPAMVAAVMVGDEHTAIHRTFLKEPGRKADLNPNKKMLGPVKGGAVRLSEASGPLVVAEGIETALSLVDGLPEASVWAALSAGNMGEVLLPGAAGDLVIAPDGDQVGRAGAVKLADRASALGWAVRIMEPPAEGDWNDLAMMEVA